MSIDYPLDGVRNLSMPIAAEVRPGLARNAPAASTAQACAEIRIALDRPALDAFPGTSGSGDEIRVPLQGGTEGLPVPLAVPADGRADVSAMRIVAEEARPILLVTLSASRDYSVRVGPDHRNLSITLGPTGCNPAAAPEQSSQKTGGAPSTTQGNPSPDTEDRDRLIAEAEAAIRSKDEPKALRLLEQLLSYIPDEHTPRARELLGLLRERAGRVEEARAIYRDYLRRYPDTEGASRVKQRLAQLGGRQEPTEQADRTLKPAQEVRREVERVEMRGVISQFYYRDRSRSVFLEAQPQTPSTDLDVRNNYDEIYSSIDATASYRNNDFRAEATLSVAHVSEYTPVLLVGATRNEGSYNILDEIYLDFADERLGASLRIGRQIEYGTGIFGRFDGIKGSVRIGAESQVNLIFGHPVWSARSTGIDASRTFYAISADIGSSAKGARGRIYWFDQRQEGGIVDRQAIGGQVRLTGERFSLTALADYDLSFGTLNAASINAAYSFKDQSTLTIAAQYLHYPTLSLTNAILAQPVPTYQTVREALTSDQIRQAARDRTMLTRQLTVTYALPIADNWNAVLDATLSDTGGSPGSFGVPAYPAPGTEWYAGGQLIGKAVLRPRDTVLIGLRLADTDLATITAADATYRFDLSTFSVAPRIRMALRQNKHDTGSSRVIAPSLRMVWHVSKDADIEAEAGGNFVHQRYTTPSLTGRREESAFIAHIGYRLRF
ncbi:tetratricopeptide repeat protein [Stakelama marina]|uniref:Tetratricopeptide repeat protein n=1 Tax=Stakelama marina TaxID=2826939 RepID=A0A8T4I7N2_9SPHN|nr:tetratricopeptide repeat protein [Stakelama marina]MBR0550998.1 tetratricopeptide repeat protein [Stakelama marina]